MGNRIAIHEAVADFHIIAFLNGNMFAFRDQVFHRFALAVTGNDDDAALVLIILAEFDPSHGFGNDGIVLGLAGLEQLRDARQATGDVAGLG